MGRLSKLFLSFRAMVLPMALPMVLPMAFIVSFITPSADARQAGQFYFQLGAGAVFTEDSTITQSLRDSDIFPRDNMIINRDRAALPTPEAALTEGTYNPCTLWKNRVRAPDTPADEGEGCDFEGETSFNPGWEVEGVVGYYLTSSIRLGFGLGYRNFTPDEINLERDQLIFALNDSEFYEAIRTHADQPGRFFGARRLEIPYDGFLANNIIEQYVQLISPDPTLDLDAVEFNLNAASDFLALARDAYQSEITDNLTIDGITLTANAYWEPTLNAIGRLVDINIADYIASHQDHQPYIGFGVGLVIWDIALDGGYHGGNTSKIVDPAPSLTFNVTFGHDYYINDRVSIGAFYRFNWTQGPELDTSGRYGILFSSIALDDITQHNLMATVKIYFR